MLLEEYKFHTPPFHGIIVQAIEVTPAIARALLDQAKSAGFTNRRLKRKVVDKYAHIMSKGGWTLNGEDIILDLDGILINGQHRLQAVIQSGVTVPFFFKLNVPRETFSTFDDGAKRTLADVLGIVGYQEESKLKTVVSWLYRWETRQLTTGAAGLDNVTGLEYTTKWKHQIQRSINFVRNRRFATLTTPMLVFCHAVFSTKSKEDADTFIEQLIEGENLSKADQTYWLRKRLEVNSSGRQRVREQTKDKVYLIFKAWNNWRKGKPPLQRMGIPAKGVSFPELT